jgi:DNA-binding protein H-NS
MTFKIKQVSKITIKEEVIEVEEAVEEELEEEEVEEMIMEVGEEMGIKAEEGIKEGDTGKKKYHKFSQENKQ